MSIVRRVLVQGVHRTLDCQPGRHHPHVLYSAMHPGMAGDPLKPSVDLSGLTSSIKDQASFGACTAFASIAIAEFKELLLQRAKATGPEVFDVSQDGGSSLSTSMLAFGQYGVVPETAWPYDPAFMYRTPSPQVYATGAQHKVTQSMQLNCLNDMLHCLSSGFPFVGGLSLFDSFMSDAVASTGTVPLPDLNTESFQGGHALSFFGYDTAKQVFIGRNSWGMTWGNKGYFTIPFAYLANPQLASDFHTIR